MLKFFDKDFPNIPIATLQSPLPSPWRSRWLLAAYLIVVWIAVITALRWPPTFEASSVVSVRPPLGTDTEKGFRPEQITRAQITLLTSEKVLRRAVAKVGAERIQKAPAQQSLLRGVARAIAGTGSRQPLSPSDHAYLAVGKAMTVYQEPQTDLIHIAFRHEDSGVAAEFTNAVVASFMDRYFELYSNASAVAFFNDQRRKSEEKLHAASARLAEYSAAKGVYLVDEQRRLLLQRMSGLNAALAATQGAVAEKSSQLNAIPALLSQMRPLARSPQIAGLLRGLPDTTVKDPTKLPEYVAVPPPSGTAPGSDEGPTTIKSEPPLLMVRTYQDTVANLVKLQTDLAGLHALQSNQQAMIRDAQASLTGLSKEEAEFYQLQIEVSQAKANAEYLLKRGLGEQLTQELNRTKLSNLQVVQEATVPLRPIWPRPGLLLLIGIALSAAPFAVGFALVATARST